MNADTAVVTGYSHRLCQDFTRVGNYKGIPEQPYAIVSDGCSGSPDTDTGARLLVHSAAGDLSNIGVTNPMGYHLSAVTQGLKEASRLGLSSRCCDATLLTAYLEEPGFFRIWAYGDGVIVMKHATGHLVIHEINFVSNAQGNSYPNYPVYKVQADSLEAYERLQKELGIKKQVTTHVLSPGLRAYTRDCKDIDLETFMGFTNDFLWVAIFSDGIQSFNRPVPDNVLGQREPVPTPEVIERLCTFRNMKGQFAERRLNRFLREVEKEGWKHEDDISMGVLNLCA